MFADFPIFEECDRSATGKMHPYLYFIQNPTAIPPQYLLPWDQGIYIGKYTQKRSGPMEGGTGKVGVRHFDFKLTSRKRYVFFMKYDKSIECESNLYSMRLSFPIAY